MSLPGKLGKISESIEVDQEESLVVNDINTSSLSQHLSTRQDSKNTLSTNRKMIFFAAAIVITIGIIFYYAIDIHLQAERSKSQILELKIRGQLEAVAQKQRTMDGEIDALRNQLKASSSELQKLGLQKLRAQLSAPAPEPSKTQTPAVEQPKKQAPLSERSIQKALVKVNFEPNVAIDIEYSSKEFGPLPINPLRVNSEGERIDNALYKDEATRKKRIGFIEQRFTFVNSNSGFFSLILAKYNLINSEEQQKKAIKENQREWLRLEAKFKLSQVKEQLLMCIVVPGYNNNANFRIEYNLNSLFTQNYSNYKVVIMNDASNDGSGELYRNFFRFYAIDKQRYMYIENQRRATALLNIYLASIYHCDKDSIVVTLDGDDQLIGRNVLQVFNWAYQSKKAGVIYSNFYWFQQPNKTWQGFTTEYSDQQKKGRLYRNVDQKFSQLRSFRAELVYQIDPKDLQDQKGDFFIIAYDMAIFFPLMELACGRANKIEGEFHYLYNRGTGLNDDAVGNGPQRAIDLLVRKRKKYECFKQFDEKMNRLPELPPAASQNAIAEINRVNMVINVEYASEEYSLLPINPLTNKEGKRIEDLLYKDEATRKKRVEFMEQRASFVNSNSRLSSLFLAKHNLVSSEEQLKKGIEDNQRDWLRLEAKFQLSRLKEELPMCIVVPSFNNNARFRIESNLNSLFTQNYTNYRVVVINDASTDDSDEVFRSFFRFHAIDKQRYTYIENVWRTFALQNIYFASINNCGKDSIILTLDGDDEFIGRNVLQVFNWAYQSKKAGVIYSNFYWFLQPQKVWQGFTIEYTDQQKKERLYRGIKQKYSQLRSFRAELLLQIDPKDLQDQKGSFFTSASDMALMLPLMQLSCARVNKIEGEFHYLFNRGTGLNDDVVNGNRQIAVDKLVRSRNKYDCFKEFDEKMKLLPALSPEKPIAKDNQANAVVNVEYASKEYGSLPIDPFRKDSEGKRIEDFLYKNEATRKKRSEFIQERASFVQANSKLTGLFLTKYNILNNEEQLKKGIEDNQRDWLRLEAKFQLSKLKEELPMCIVVPSYNNNARFRIESNLNSLFTQNYTNYKVVIVNDASTDDSDEVFRSFFSFHAIDKQRYTYIENVWRTFALQNIYFASINHCGKDSIVVNLDGDDEFIGRNVLQVFNWAYQSKKAGVIYSNFYNFHQSSSVFEGWTSQYPDDVKQNGLFRSTSLRFNHLLSFRNELTFLVDPKDLRDEAGAFFTVSSDFALILPLTELSCGRVHKIQGEFHYLFNTGTGLNDDQNRQVAVEQYVRRQPKYECAKEFDERMKK